MNQSSPRRRRARVLLARSRRDPLEGFSRHEQERARFFPGNDRRKPTMARQSAAARKIFVIAFAQPGDEGVSCRPPADSSGPMCFRERGKKFAGVWGKSTDSPTCRHPRRGDGRATFLISSDVEGRRTKKEPTEVIKPDKGLYSDVAYSGHVAMTYTLSAKVPRRRIFRGGQGGKLLPRTSRACSRDSISENIYPIIIKLRGNLIKCEPKPK